MRRKKIELQNLMFRRVFSTRLVTVSTPAGAEAAHAAAPSAAAAEIAPCAAAATSIAAAVPQYLAARQPWVQMSWDGSYIHYF